MVIVYTASAGWHLSVQFAPAVLPFLFGITMHMARKGTRSPLRPGSVTRSLEHNAAVRRRLDDERARHRDALGALSARLAELQVADLAPQVRAARVGRVVVAQDAEMDRHRRTLARLREGLR